MKKDILTICFTGHRPDKLGGYDWYGDKNEQIRFNLMVFMKKIINLNSNIKIKAKVGGALGFDQFAFAVCHRLKEEGYDIDIEVCIPFADQYIKWRDIDQDRYFEQCQLADKRTYIDRCEGYQLKDIDSGIYHPAKMQKRNEYMVDRSDVVISLWDGSKGGTANCVRYAKKKSKTVIIINPETWKIEVEYNQTLPKPLKSIDNKINL